MKKVLNKDSQRAMKVDDIQGAKPRELNLIPPDKLPNLHPMF